MEERKAKKRGRDRWRRERKTKEGVRVGGGKDKENRDK